MALLISAILTAAAADLPNTAEAAGVTFSWQIEGDHLVGQLSATTSGWVLVGFNDHTGLDGSRLVFGAVEGGVVRAEEHLADPPVHHTVATLPAEAISGTLADGTVTVRFQIPLAREGLLTLTPGQTLTAWLAWSHDADFQHHSARRERVTLTL